MLPGAKLEEAVRTYPLRRSAVGVNPRCVSKPLCTPWFSEPAKAIPPEDLQNDSQESVESSFSLPDESLPLKDKEQSTLVPVSTPVSLNTPVHVSTPVRVTTPAVSLKKPARSVADTLKSLKDAYVKDTIKKDVEKKEELAEAAGQQQEEPEPVKNKKRKKNETTKGAPEKEKNRRRPMSRQNLLLFRPTKQSQHPVTRNQLLSRSKKRKRSQLEKETARLASRR